mgnify:FL=1
MSIYTIADLHLSIGAGIEKSMEVFGRRWQGYTEKLKKNWCAVVEPGDSVIIPGDISWALSLTEALEDFKFIDGLPGTKYLGKGNHDFWWATQKKMTGFFQTNSLNTLRLMHNCAYEIEDYILCGTRGWFYDDTASGIPENTDFSKLINRETQRLSLEEAYKLQLRSEKPILAFLHFPPVWNGCVCSPFVELLLEYGVKKCYFGHIHGAYSAPPFTEYAGIRFVMISADYLNFIPRIIFPPSFD